MNRYALYDPATGSIKAILWCSADGAALQARDGLETLPLPDGFAGDDTTHRVVDGEVVAR